MMTIRSLCSKCGTIERSGKVSCCGRGGSWYRNCGSASNAKVDHTWCDGIQACKERRQSRRAIGQHLKDAQQKGIDSSHGTRKANSKADITAAKPFTFTSASMSI